MLTLDTPQIQQNMNTEIRLTSDHGNFSMPVVGQASNPVFTISGAGGSIVSQYIVDRYTALITILGSTAETLLTILDPLNNEAVTVSVHTSAVLQSEQTADGNQASEVTTPGDDAPPPPIDIPT